MLDAMHAPAGAGRRRGARAGRAAARDRRGRVPGRAAGAHGPLRRCWSGTGFDVDGAADGHLGLGFDVALQCVDRSGWAAEKLEALRRRAHEDGDPKDGVRPLLVPAAEPFFRADGLRVPGPLTLDAAFAILVVLSGGGRLRTEHGGELELARGHTVLVPHAAGRSELSGRLEAVRCRPPLQPPASELRVMAVSAVSPWPATSAASSARTACGPGPRSSRTWSTRPCRAG